jgi:hypothetical protein
MHRTTRRTRTHAAPHAQKRKRLFKKAPGAPTRGRSAYVLYSLAKREEVKAGLPEGSKVRRQLCIVPRVSRRSLCAGAVTGVRCSVWHGSYASSATTSCH